MLVKHNDVERCAAWDDGSDTKPPGTARARAALLYSSFMPPAARHHNHHGPIHVRRALSRFDRYRNKKGRPPGLVAGFFVAIRMDLDFSKLDGLISAVVQDYSSGRVLMVGYMNGEAFRRTVETGFAIFYSRSRQKLWLKGETSGHRLAVKEISTDCDQDALLVRVEPQGPGVCHNGYESCFYRRLENGQWVESEPRAYDPAAVYGSQA